VNSLQLSKRTKLHKEKKYSVSKDFFSQYDLFLMVLPGLILVAIFNYAPMYGLSIAFKDYNIIQGIIKSPWAGLKHFKELFVSLDFKRVFTNTLLISIYRLVFQFPIPIILALMLNEVKNESFKKIVQNVTYLPHFVSWAIFGAIVLEVLSREGIVNKIIIGLGLKPLLFMTKKEYFRSIIVASQTWKEAGWSAIIYLAALSSIDPQLYEAAIVDGAGKLSQIWYITLPGIMSTVVFILILRMGSLLSTDVEQILMLYNPLVYETGDVIGTYVYRIGLGQMKYDFTTAVGLFQSLIGLILILASNYLSRKTADTSLF
jgi:putative aldouronate transport system permease protein